MKSKKISNKKMIDHYKMMLLIRKCEESFVKPILDGTINCPVHLYTGQEAIAVGMSAFLRKDDIIFGNHRSHGHYLAKGGDIFKMISEIYTREAGCAKGRGGSMHLVDKEVGMLGAAPIVAGTISLTLGAALVQSLEKKRRVSVAYFGDGASGEGVLYECFNFAALKKLPLIFVCENNYYSTHLPIKDTRPNIPIHKIGLGFGIQSYHADGNDLLKVLRVAEEAINYCRKGYGPVFIEFSTYRMRGHVGPSDNIQGTHTDIRPQSEIDTWKLKDPIKRMEKYIIKNKLLDLDKMNRISSKIDQQLSIMHLQAKNSNSPSSEELTYHVFK